MFKTNISLLCNLISLGFKHMFSLLTPTNIPSPKQASETQTSLLLIIISFDYTIQNLTHHCVEWQPLPDICVCLITTLTPASQFPFWIHGSALTWIMPMSGNLHFMVMFNWPVYLRHLGEAHKAKFLPLPCLQSQMFHSLPCLLLSPPVSVSMPITCLLTA